MSILAAPNMGETGDPRYVGVSLIAAFKGSGVNVVQTASFLSNSLSDTGPWFASFANQPAIGNYVCVIFSAESFPPGPITIGDNQTNVYSFVVAGTLTQENIYCYLAPIVTSSGTFTVEATVSSPGDSHWLAILELNTLSGTIDASASQSIGRLPSINITVPDFVIAALNNGPNFPIADTGFTIPSQPTQTLLSPTPDSTGLATLGGTLINGPTAALGVYGGGINFVSSSTQTIKFGNEQPFSFNTAMMEAWIKTSSRTANAAIYEYRRSGGGDNACILYLDTNGFLNLLVGSGPTQIITASTNLADGNFHHVVGIGTNGGNLTLFQDGVSAASPVSINSGTVDKGAGDAFIGSDFTEGSCWNGIIDEVRLSKVARSGDWIQATYNNGISQSTFYTIGSEFLVGSIVGRPITINHTKIPNTDQINFPVGISGVFPYLATIPNGGKVANIDGFDVIFTSDALGANLLNWEVVTYVAGNGQVQYFIQIPTVSHTVDTTFYIFYNNPSIVSDLSNKHATWDSNFVGVFHLDSVISLSQLLARAWGGRYVVVETGNFKPAPSGWQVYEA